MGKTVLSVFIFQWQAGGSAEIMENKSQNKLCSVLLMTEYFTFNKTAQMTATTKKNKDASKRQTA